MVRPQWHWACSLLALPGGCSSGDLKERWRHGEADTVPSGWRNQGGRAGRRAGRTLETLHLRAFKQVRKHRDPRPRQGQSRRLSLTSEPAEERKGTASAVHQSGRRSRCRGSSSCCLNLVASFARALLWRFCYIPEESPVLLWDQKETAWEGHRALGFHHRPGQPHLLCSAL